MLLKRWYNYQSEYSNYDMIHKHRKYVCVSVYIRAFLLFLLKALLFHIALKHDGKLKGIMVYVKKNHIWLK